VGDTTWTPLKVGAGGWLTGIDIDPTGTTYAIRTDTYGAYVGDGSGAWAQVVNAASMPSAFLAGFATGTEQALGEGVYEIRVAPSNSSVLYMVYRSKVFKSVDRGATWTQTQFSTSATLDPNNGYRYWGEKAAVCPTDPNLVLVGAGTDGLYRTTNGGTTWAKVNSGVTPGAQGITGIVWANSTTVYACWNGSGVYRSTDSGATWGILSGGPTTVSHAAVATDGVFYSVAFTSSVYRYMSGAWATLSGANDTNHTVACDPNNAARIIVGRDSGHLCISTDRGASWGTGTRWTVTRTAADVPWLGWASESYMSSGGMRFDPVVADKLWFSEGIGVWYCTAPSAATTAWVSKSAGIEQMVGRDVCLPPGGPNVIAAGMDRSVWVLPKANTSYPSQYVTMGSSASLIPAWAVDYSHANPAHIVAVINLGQDLSGYSLDSGATWTKFPAQPATGTSGDIVAPSIDSIIAVIGTQWIYRSTNRGVSWSQITLLNGSGSALVPSATVAGVGATEAQCLHNGYNNKKHILAVDGATPSTVYLYKYPQGVYRSTDSGATWTLVNQGSFAGGNMFWQTKLRSVPGKAGHLFLMAGQSGGGGNQNPHSGTALYRSTDGGSNWTTVSGIGEPYDVALGKAAPGQTYPAIYVVGWYNNVYGIWRSIDNAATWTQIGPYPFDSIDEINVIAASQDTYGDVYVAFNGSGWGYGSLAIPVTYPTATTWEATVPADVGASYDVTDGVDTINVAIGPPFAPDLPRNVRVGSSYVAGPFLPVDSFLTPKTKGVASDASVLNRQYKTPTAGAVVATRTLKTFTSDAAVAVRLTQPVTAGAAVSVTVPRQVVAGAVVSASGVTQTATAGALVRASYTQTATADGAVATRLAQTAAADAAVSVSRTNTLAADGFVSLPGLRAVTITGDAAIQGGHTVSVGADASVSQAGTVLKNITANALVRGNVTRSATGDAFVQNPGFGRVYVDTPADGVVLAAQTKTVTANAIVGQYVTAAQNITAGALVRDTVTATVDATGTVLDRRTDAVPADAIVFGSRVELVAADASVAGTVEHAVAVSACITSHVHLDVIADGTVSPASQVPATAFVYDPSLAPEWDINIETVTPIRLAIHTPHLRIQR
jgi:hypothetical protein